MKKVFVELDMELEQIESVNNQEAFCGLMPISCDREYIYKFRCNKLINSSSNIRHAVEMEVPETIKEFREENHLTKEELLDFLIKNYDKYDRAKPMYVNATDWIASLKASH